MSEHPESAKGMKRVIYPFAIWLLVVILVLTIPLPFPAFIGLGILFFPLVGFFLILFYVYMLFKSKNKVSSLILILAIALGSVLIFYKGITLGAIARFYLNRSRYEATVASIKMASDGTEKEARCSGDCWIISEEDNQIGFHYAHGFLNWHDIVYDPTGEVERAKTVEQRFKFNVYFREADHITGAWYVCHFSD